MNTDSLSHRFDEAFHAGNVSLALSLARQWTAEQPEIAASHTALGMALQASQRPHEAIGALSLALHRDPNQHRAYPWLCAALLFVNSPAVAVEICALARQTERPDPDMLWALADLFLVIAPDYARELLDLALLESPDHQKASLQALLLNLQQQNIGAAQAVLEQFKSASTDTLHAEILNILLAQESGQASLANDMLHAALRRYPDTPSLLFNAAQLALQQGNRELARTQLQQSLDQHALPDAAFLLAGLDLLERNWTAGFKHYESRRLVSRKMPFFHTPDLPEWRGQKPLAESRILVVDEQGYGDTLMFSRFLPHLQSMVAKLGFQTRPALYPLFAHQPRFVDIELFAGYGEIQADSYDYFIPLLSLPERLGITPSRNQLPYLTAPKCLLSGWKHPARAHPELPGIGLVWRTNSPTQSSSRRSFSDAEATELINVCQGDWYSLTVGNLQPESMNATCTDWSGRLLNFAETAAAISALDAIVSIDTAVAHLAGALGKPVLLLLNNDPEWRWATDPERTDQSYWYPEITLLKLKPDAQWPSLFPAIQYWLGQFRQQK